MGVFNHGGVVEQDRPSSTMNGADATYRRFTGPETTA